MSNKKFRRRLNGLQYLCATSRKIHPLLGAVWRVGVVRGAGSKVAVLIEH